MKRNRRRYVGYVLLWLALAMAPAGYALLSDGGFEDLRRGFGGIWAEIAAPDRFTGSEDNP